MLNFSSFTENNSLGKLKNSLRYNETEGDIENVYKNSEALSNHISSNILESLREQLSRQGLQVDVESEQDLETSD
ncbi:hypothetical protein [Psychrobacter sp. UBA6291]|uniref:hypothetical protein n=1 Tax=Psychrobacter sp. UBA6291 TaxID=1947357 RepID=UPI00257D7B9A|nr:hypothetical protein [Psychrobacter sp. UBA6291]